MIPSKYYSFCLVDSYETIFVASSTLYESEIEAEFHASIVNEFYNNNYTSVIRNMMLLTEDKGDLPG